MKIFPPTKAFVTSVYTKPDLGMGPSAHGEMVAVTSIARPEGEPVGVMQRLTLNYEVWGEDAILRMRDALVNREEIDLSLGL